jgi:alkanesulfonate monooxygenase SsuD/methylene tetrahydromethanopterin reductase-like flavin-dependent oxidoreductase (luciferase family)
MDRPFTISVMQPTMEPVAEVLDYARAVDELGFDTIWLAESYHWWRKHSMEARSATALSALIGHVTDRVRVAWGIITPASRHPLEIAMEARVMQEVCGPGRFAVGLGASKIFLNHLAGEEHPGVAKPATAIEESVGIIKAALSGEAVDIDGAVYSAHIPPLRDDAETPRGGVPLYIAGTGPRLQKMAGAVADGLLTASLTTPGFVEYARANVEAGARSVGRDPSTVTIGCTCVASIGEDREAGRAGAREYASMYLANKVQNIRESSDVLLNQAGLTREELEPVAAAMESGGRFAARDAVSDSTFQKINPIAGTPNDCIEAIERFRAAGADDIMLEIWGDDRMKQIRLFGEKVLPHFAS